MRDTSFESFVASRHTVDDVRPFFPDDFEHYDTPIGGCIYWGDGEPRCGCFIVGPYENGQYHLIVERDEYTGTLPELEAILHSWAKDEYAR